MQHLRKYESTFLVLEFYALNMSTQVFQENGALKSEYKNNNNDKPKPLKEETMLFLCK